MQPGAWGTRAATPEIVSIGGWAPRRHTSDDNSYVANEGIKVGDRVTLRGGPVMTVQARSQNLAYCAWTNGDGRLHQGTFEVGNLHLVSEQPLAGREGDVGQACT